MSQRYPPPHQRYTPRQSQYTPGRFEHDRWNRDDRRASPRGFSPVRDRRDSRDHGPRDLDIDRAQRLPRDGGPASAGSNISDAGRFSNAAFRGSSYTGRGRGRDWTDRGRQRAFAADDRERDTFRPRSRSRPRVERDRSVDSRDFERRDERRDDYRREDDWHYRRPRPDERDFGRRDGLSRVEPRPLETKPPDDTRGLSPADRQRLSSPHRRPSPELKKDFDPPRRQSTLGDLFPHAAARRDLERADIPSTRSDAIRERPAARPSDTDGHLSVAVPQFGSIPLSAQFMTPKPSGTNAAQAAKASVTKTVTPEAEVPAFSPKPSSVELRLEMTPDRNSTIETSTPPSIVKSNDQAMSLPQSHTSVAQPQTTPKSELQELPTNKAPLVEAPTAPKADRERSVAASDKLHDPDDDISAREPKPQSLKAQAVLPEPKVEFGTQDALRTPSRVIPVGSPVRQNRLAPPTAPTGPRVSVNQRALSAGPLGRDDSPTLTSFTSVITLKASPAPSSGLPINVPTGPKADRTSRLPPTAPRSQQNFQGRPSITSLQWRANPGAVLGRATLIPAKRDADGEEKDFGSQRLAMAPTEPLDNQNAHHIDARSHIKVETHIQRDHSSRLPFDEDVQMEDAPGARSPEALAFDTDDDDMALDEDDFHEQAARYKHKKADLESQHADLVEQWQRVATLIEESDRLRGILSIINDLPLPDRPPPPPQSMSASIASCEVNPNVLEVLSQPINKQQRERSLLASLHGSPDLPCLPYFEGRPLTPSLTSDDTEDFDQTTKQMLVENLFVVEDEQAGLQQTLAREFLGLYKPWKRHINMMQKVKDDAEAEAAALLAEQHKITTEVPEPVTEIAPAPLLTPNAERRRQFTSVLDLQRVLEESRQEEEARREKAEREAKEARASAEREATIFPLLCKEDLALRIFQDTSLLRTAEESLRVFEYAPPVDTFTKDEDRRLRDEYDLGTKMWHKIADAVGRTTKECINHYYATKWEQPYKRQKHKKRKGKKGVNRRIDADIVPQDTVIGLTETGRPRRAAAPTFSKNEKGKADDVDTDTAAGKKNVGSKPLDTTLTEEKTARGRKSTKEKQPRKPRGQQIVAKAAPSPQKVPKDKIMKETSTVLVPDMSPTTADPIRLVQQPVYSQERMMTALLPSHSTYIEPHAPLIQNKPELPPPSMPPLPAATTITAPVLERPRSHSQTQRAGPSSYWSVPEEAEFKECLKYFGTDFNAIANHMGKKTAVMCKNHFSKYKQDPIKYSELLAGTREADERRKTGAPLPALPNSLRKKHESSSINSARMLVPPTEASESISPSAAPMNDNAHFHPHGRIQVLHQQQIAAAPQGYAGHIPPASQNMQHKQRINYFPDSSPNKTQMSHASPTTDSAMSLESGRPTQVGRIKTEYEPQVRPAHLSGRDQDHRTSTVPRAMGGSQHTIPEGQLKSQRIVGLENSSGDLMNYSVELQPHLGPNIRPQMHDIAKHGHAPHQRHAEVSAASSMLQNQQHVQLEQLGQPLRPQSPAIRDYGTGPKYAQRPNPSLAAQPHVSRAQEAPTGPPSAPSRKVNIMSMLNPEPTEESRPRRSEAERSRPVLGHTSHQAPSDQYNAQHTDQYHESVARRNQNAIYPGTHQIVAPEPGHPPATRENWSGRSSFVHSAPTSDSPHMQHVPVHGSANARDFRSHMGSISHQRAMPSPPGNRYAHSRNSSFNQPQAGPVTTTTSTAPPEAYSTTVRSGYAQPHTQGPPAITSRASALNTANYSGGYIDQPGMLLAGHIDPRDPRSREAGLRSSGGYRREYDMALGRDQRDAREMRDRREMPPQAQHLYHHQQQHGAHNHGSPHPPGNGRYGPPSSTGRLPHAPPTQAYAGEHRGMEAPQRDYEGPPAASHDAREREWAYNEEMRRMQPRR